MKKIILLVFLVLVAFGAAYLFTQRKEAFLSSEAKGYLIQMDYRGVFGAPDDLIIKTATVKSYPYLTIGEIHFQRVGPLNLVLKLKGVEWDIKAALLKKGKENVLNVFKSYTPYRDILKSPAVSLILADYPILRGDIVLNISLSQNGFPVVFVTLQTNNFMDIELEIKLKNRSDDLFHQIVSYALKGKLDALVQVISIDTLGVKTEDTGFWRAYQTYVQKLPQEYVEDLSKSVLYDYFSKKENQAFFNFNPFL